MNKLPHLDLFTGIAGFSLEAERTGRFKTIMASEIDPYCNKLISDKWGMENAGSVESVAVHSSVHPDRHLIDADIVPCEETGFTSLCLEDFYEGAIDFPYLVTGGFPCVNVSSANTNAQGIDGEFSNLVKEQMRIIADLEPELCVFENAALLVGRGLDYILAELSSLGYIAEWETLTAAAFGYPHYRHRCYVVAYLADSDIAKSGARVFDLVREQVPEQPSWNLPLNKAENAKKILDLAVVENPKSIKLRTKRINALGNSIIPDIAAAIFEACLKLIDGCKVNDSERLPSYATLKDGEWTSLNPSTQSDSRYFKLPASGYMADNECFAPAAACRKLNPTKNQYENLFSTLIKKDGNNNFSSKSRTNRPGKLGGLIGDITLLGTNTGGLSPLFAELFMGYENGYTELPQKTAPLTQNLTLL